MTTKTIFTWILALLASSSLCAQEQFRLAAEDDWFPYSVKSGNEAQGRSVEIVRAAYAAVGASILLDVVPFNRGMVRTKEGSYVGVFNAGVNEDVRRDYLIPRNTIALSEQALVSRVGEPFQGKQSFNGRRLALTLGYTYPSDIVDDPNNTVERAFKDINNLNKIALGRADYTIIDRLVYLSIVARSPA